MSKDSNHRSGSPGAERRRSSRIPLRQSVRVHADGQVITAQAYNVSFGGLALKSPVALAPGSDVEVELALPGRRLTNALHLPCRVVHAAPVGDSNGQRLGLEFRDLDGRNAGLLEAFFAERRAARD